MSCRLSPPLSGEREGQRSPRVVFDTILGTLDAVAVVNTADQLFTIRSFPIPELLRIISPKCLSPVSLRNQETESVFSLSSSFFSLSLEFSREDAGNDRRGRLRFLDCIIDLLMSRGTY